jgi:hypothetical protein
MKKPKKKTSKPTKTPRNSASREDKPLEFDRGWQELEEQHDRLKMDFSSLAAQLGIDPKDKGQEL